MSSNRSIYCPCYSHYSRLSTKLLVLGILNKVNQISGTQCQLIGFVTDGCHWGRLHSAMQYKGHSHNHRAYRTTHSGVIGCGKDVRTSTDYHGRKTPQRCTDTVVSADRQSADVAGEELCNPVIASGAEGLSNAKGRTCHQHA